MTLEQTLSCSFKITQPLRSTYRTIRLLVIWLIQIILFLLSVYSALVALLFSAFLIYDTQQIMGGKKYEISPEEHVYASIQLYVDVVYIFLAILSLGRR